jgi:anthranilate/para-aminobenzoate synthase component II
MSKKIVICDFEDSFTFNIYSCVKDLFPDIPIEVIPKKRLLIFLQTVAAETDDQVVVILGPGPGHPDEYEFLYSSIMRLLKSPNFFLMGICLGHQILCTLRGLNIEHSYSPIHGQTQQYTLDDKLQESLSLPLVIEVQRYNSLAVKITNSQRTIFSANNSLLLIEKDEVIILKQDNLVSYQFHPESVGTTCPKYFFTVLAKFLI